MRKPILFLLLILTCLGAYGQNDYYWVGGSGNWSDISHWVTSSGGSQNYGVIPSPQDNVFFDENSFDGANQTLNINVNRASFQHMDWSGIDQDIVVTGSGEIESYGSITLSERLTWEYVGNIVFRSSRADEVFKTANQEFQGTISFSNGGTWTVMDSLLTSDGNGLRLFDASLNAKDLFVRTDFLDASQDEARVIDLTNSDLELRGGFEALLLQSDQLTLTATGSSISFTNEFSNGDVLLINGSNPLVLGDLSFLGASGNSNIQNRTDSKLTFGNVLFTGNGAIYGDSEMGDLSLGVGKFYLLEASKTHRINGSFMAAGNCSELTVIRSTIAGVQTTIEKTSGQVDLDFVDLMDLAAVGGAVFNASNSNDSGNNSGWNISLVSSMDFYWIGGTGSWDDPANWSLTSGGAPSGCLPSLRDNVFFDQNSFSQPGQQVTINQTVSCRSMDWTGALNSPTFFGDDTENLMIYGSLSLIPDMNFNLEGSILFVSDQSGNTVESGNLDLRNFILFNGAGGEWTLLDSLKTNQAIDLSQGGLFTNGNFLRANNFSTTGQGIREVNFGSSDIDIKSSFNLFLTNLTVNAEDASITFTGEHGEFHIDGATSQADVTFKRVVFNGFQNGSGRLANESFDPAKILIESALFERSANLNGDIRFDSLFLTAGNSFSLSHSNTKTVNKHFEAKGNCSGTISLNSNLSGMEATITSLSASIDVERVFMQDVHANGGATFIANNSFDLGNNDGWNFTNVLIGTDLYWVGGDGSWHDEMNWSYTSGGPGGACVPTLLDNVFFDSQSFTATEQAVQVNSTARCRNMDWTGALFEPSFTSSEAVYISGSLVLISAMSYNINNQVVFCANTLGHTITTSGLSIGSPIRFTGNGGGWEFLDDFNGTSGITILHEAGQLKTNNHLFQGGFFSTSGNLPRELDFGVSTVRFTSLALTINEEFVFSLGSANYFLEGNNPALQVNIFKNIGIDLGNVRMTGTGPFPFSSINVHPNVLPFTSPKFKTIELHNSSSLYFGNRKTSIDSLLLDPGYEYSISASDTLAIQDYLLANGDCSTRLSLVSNSSSGDPFFIEKPSGDVTINYVSLRNSHIYGPGQFLANNTRDLGGNDGWSINSELGTDLYWVGGTGDWSDPAHWALTSGGPGGACVPFIYDNVFFDENSFDGPNQRVELDEEAYCRNMDWTGAQFSPVFTGPQQLEVYGSITLNSDMTYDHNSDLLFMSDSLSNSITSRGTSVSANVHFNGAGEWILAENFESTSDITFNRGRLILDGFTLTGAHFRSELDSTRYLDMENSVIRANQDFSSISIDTEKLTLISEGSTFEITSSSSPQLVIQGSDSLTFGNVQFNAANGGAGLEALLDTEEYDFIGVFNDVSFNGNGQIRGNNQFSNLTFAPGQVYKIEESSIQRIVDNWNMRGIGCSPIIIESDQPGQRYHVIKEAGTVDGLYLRLTDSEVSGGATFNAINSADVSNNSGWNFVVESIVVEDILGEDQVACDGEQVVLDASFGAANESFVWSDGSTNATLNVNQPGKYWVNVSIGQSCLLSDTVNIDFNPLPIVDLGEDITTCEEQPVVIDATNPNNTNVTYMWSDGSTLPTLTVETTGHYWVDVTMQDCPVRDSIFVQVDPIPRIDLGPDIVASCEDDLIVLDAFYDGATYLWQDGSTNPTLEVRSPGTYSVTLDRNGCLFTDEIQIDFLDYPQADLGPDIVICPNEDNFLDVTQTIPGNFTYLWSNGDTNPRTLLGPEGDYWVTVSNGVCSETDTISVSYIPVPIVELGEDVILCEGDVLTLDAFNNGATYLWSTGETTPSIDVSTAGTYSVEVTDGCYIVNDEITIEVDIIPTVDLGEDVGICFYDTLKFDVTIASPKATYVWEDGSTDPRRVIYEEGTYSVAITNGLCGTAVDEIVVQRDFCGCEIFAPNIFSPNGDGTNDIFKTVQTCTPDNYTLSIYSKWGLLIYQTNDPDRGWDGTYDGEALWGHFLWKAEYISTRINGSIDRVTGNGIFRILR